jgi:kynurenine formamidase
MSQAQYDIAYVREKALQYRNWGRWGTEDELGTLNFVTDEMRANAARLARKGKVFSLALPLDVHGPMVGAHGRINPYHFMIWDGGDFETAQDFIPAMRYTDDAVFLVLQSSTQWDSLAHIFFDGQMYNGHGPERVSSKGASVNSMTNVRDQAVGRGVLLDIARYKGLSWLPTSYAITKEDLEGCAESQGVEVGEGDFVLLRTGQMAERRAAGSWGDYAGGPAPGMGITCADFFCPRNVAAVATDTWGTEVLPNETPDVFQPLHCIMLVNAGIILGEMWDMEALAEDCAADGVWEFLLVAPPLTITGSVGSPVNPQAIK